MKGQETNSATCEISQVAKISQPGNFQAQKLLSQPTATPAKTKKKKKLEDMLKRENLQKENKPTNNKGHKKITKKIKK